ncbi:MAG: Holliday junction resolvase RuvX [Candidatus Acidiferrales bacterium]
MTIPSRTSSTAAAQLSRTETIPGRILALDYGRSRIGIAVSDELRISARPLETLEHVNRRKDVQRLREIARKQQARKILVGHPVHLNGVPGEMAEEAARFARRLGKELGLPVELVDERLTSWEAAQSMAETRPAARRGSAGRRKALDQVAAAVMLREYLDRERDNAKSKGH